MSNNGTQARRHYPGSSASSAQTNRGYGRTYLAYYALELVVVSLLSIDHLRLHNLYQYDAYIATVLYGYCST